MAISNVGRRAQSPFSAAGFLPDPTFYPSPRSAAQAPPETVAYMALVSAEPGRPDALGVVDVQRGSKTYGQLLGRLDLPTSGDELHHFGWNACSSALCPYAPHPHQERRYLIVPGIRSSRVYVVDTKPDGADPRAGELRIVKTIEPDELMAKSGYSRPHTVHCGPEGIYVSALGSADGGAPGGIFIMDHDTFDVRGRWEIDRGPQSLAYDFAWHLADDTMVTSEWGTPDMIEGGLDLEALVGKRYGQAIHFWDLRKRRHLARVPVGEDDQITLELRPAHDPTKLYGFVGVVTNVKTLASSVWVWHRDGGKWAARQVIDIPAEPADPELLPPALKPFGAVPPLVSDIDLSVDDRFLYVSCWGTGELRQYDVSDPFNPKQTGSVHLGGIVRRAAHPSAANRPLTGGPQMVEVSRDGRRVYLTNGLYLSWDAQFYPAGIDGWLVKLDVGEQGGLTPDPNFLLETPKGTRTHQVRLEGGDASSDSYCYP
jgi:methanethiol oxidase